MPIPLARPVGPASRPSRRRRRRAVSSVGRVEEALAPVRRTLLVGDAGSGKTTLLRWLAVHCARRDLPGAFADWHGVVPFLIVLRRYVGQPLPRPEQFLDTVGNAIAAEMPAGWVQHQLRGGRAVVLVDGVDELPEAERHRARSWLRELVGAFPSARYVITTRPAAVPPDWLDQLDFGSAELQPMSALDVRAFVEHWHQAVGDELPGPAEREALARCEESILHALSTDRHLRRLAVSPLLCALLCALNRELRNQLPRSRMEVYEAALIMLLDQRDRERGVSGSLSELTRTEKIVLLQGLALWLVRNGRSQASTAEAARQLAASMSTLRPADDQPPAATLLRYLLERSGVLQAPTVDSVDFVHRTFQEYLAGKAAVDGEFIGELIRNADDDQWREVIVMASGHAHPKQSAKLLSGLVGGRRNSRLLIALACLQTASQVDQDLRRRVQGMARLLMPPKTRHDAEALAAAGEFVLDLLPQQPKTQGEADAICHTAARIGGDEALPIIARLVGHRPRPSVYALVDGWESFDPVEYARRVMAHAELGSGMIALRQELIHALPLLRNLEGVDVPCTDSVADILTVLPSMPNIRELGLRGTNPRMKSGRHRMGHDGMLARQTEPLSGQVALNRITFDIDRLFPNATDLSLANFSLTDLRALSYANGITELMITNWPRLTSLDGINMFPNLTSLYLANSGNGPVELAAAMLLPKLTTLTIESPKVDLSSWRMRRVETTLTVRVTRGTTILGLDDAVSPGLTIVEG